MVECGPGLRIDQEHRVRARYSGVHFDWVGVIEEVPLDAETVTVVYCNEFFDALPIHIFKASFLYGSFVTKSDQSVSN